MTEAEFLRDVEKHEMIVVKDDGLHRHIRLKRPSTGYMSFVIVTWPGYLAYSGDMGCYVFSRLPDMFEFFRTDIDSPYLKAKGVTLGINPSYWGEKLQAVDKNDGYKQWSPEKFRGNLRERFNQWAEDRDFSDDLKAEAWKNVESEVIWRMDDGGQEHAYRQAMDFTFDGSHPFAEFYEYNSEDYSGRFMWCCYALAWAIKTYDQSKVPA